MLNYIELIILRNYNILIEKNIFSDILSLMIKRLEAETQKLLVQNNISEACLNNMLLMCEDDYVIDNFINEFEEKIESLFIFLVNSSCVAIYDSILLIIDKIIDFKKSIPPFIMENIESLNTIFLNNGNQFNNLFQIVNKILTYGKHIIIIHENLRFLEMVNLFFY